MSANDVLDVLNISREEVSKQPQKKRVKTSNDASKQTGMARELYSLLGPNTPPVNLNQNTKNMFSKDKLKMKVSPWTRMPFEVNGKTFHHWVKGSRELLDQEQGTKPYFFDKFNIKLETPALCDKETYEKIVEDINKELQAAKTKKDEVKQEAEDTSNSKKSVAPGNTKDDSSTTVSKAKEDTKSTDDTESKDDKNSTDGDKPKEGDEERSKKTDAEKETDEKTRKDSDATDSKSQDSKSRKRKANEMEDADDEPVAKVDFSYEETEYLWDLCQVFELKWPIVYDRYNYMDTNRSLEELKEHFYRVCIKLLEGTGASSTNDDFISPAPNSALVDSLKAFSRKRETDRKVYLENLLKRTPAEIAEEESLVIEARRFEMAAKKMLMERSNLLALLDSPSTTQSVQSYQSSQGLSTLYNNLMIYDKNQKRKSSSVSASTTKSSQNPVPPAIPPVASSSIRRDRAFQTHLQQYLATFLKQGSAPVPTAQGNAIKQLLQKRLTQKEEDAYGLHYHSTEKMVQGVTLRSAQRLPALQQKQSTLKSVQMLLQELDIPTGGGTTWRPLMPTRKTMAKYDEVIRAAVTLIDVKKARDKLEAEIRLVKSQRGNHLQ
ncbi:hypothetical protein DIURU_003750 [Diutina rugosa]|uniref:SWR1-complex protein 4 n=1 Tax=Diutina rugosa TaxID=5481 RepID=A0A642URQ6_DIURU|nr:uncharacterized protein DIURU_003750 [Diutina rugosa]KAA8900548.1 hypothetical protein DIURU_003750 [Diutina rugosa]